MAKKRVSIYDIARQLEVSVSTVSRALSDSPSISEALKGRVRALASELNYTPNSVAVNLKSGRRNTIGVVVPSIGRSFFSSAIEGIEDEAYKRGYDVLIYQSKDSAQRERRIVSALGGKVDGVIASVSADVTDHLYYNQLHQVDLPLVLFDRMVSGVEAGTVTANDYQGAVMAVNHLLEQGCRRIYHLAGPQHISIWRERQSGYLDAMHRAGITPQPHWIIEGPTTRVHGAVAARSIIDNGPFEGLPDAIFCAGDYSALGAMLAFQAAGISIPGQVAVVGYANEPFCTLLPVPLSSVEQYSHRMGQMACKMLLDRLDGQPQVGVVINPQIIIRASSTKIHI